MNLVVEMVELQEALKIIDSILKDRTVPKNIRAAVERAKNSLESSEEDSVKISTAIQILDEIANEANMPMYARTKIWNVVSILEEKRKEIG
jgi:uncharacterized protein (UPF0147 family)